MKSRHPRRSLLTAVLAAGAALAVVPSAQAADAPSFQCRASALAASVSEQPYVEPLVANGIKGSVPGATFDKPLCSNDEQGTADLTNSVGLQGLLGASAAKVKTTLTPDTGPSAGQTATASTLITDADVRLGATPSQILQIEAVKATATARCVNNKAVFDGTSEVTNVRLFGQPISLDGLLGGVQQLLDQTGLSALVKITALNKVEKTANSVVVTPLRIQVLSGTGSPGGVVDLTVGETKVAQRGNACAPPGDGDGGPAKACPVGSIPVGATPTVCQIPGTDRFGTIIIGALGTLDVPTGGRVVALPEARRLAAAGTIPRSSCLSGPGLDYVVLGDAGRNTIYGTRNRDRLMSLGGGDKVHGRNAGDCLDGGTGNDRLYGDADSDRVYGGTGNDRMYGDRGNDRMYGQAGNDLLRGNDGTDRLFGESGNDRLFGNDGRDRIDGGAGRDRLSGGFNANVIIGGTGRALVVNGKPFGSRKTTIDLRRATAPSVVKCGSRSDVVRVNRKYAKRNRYSGNCTTIRVSR